MAEALVRFVVMQLNDVIKDESGLLLGAPKEVEKLRSTFDDIQALLRDAERRQVKEDSVKNWLRKLKDVAYEVEDVIDIWRTSSYLGEVNDDRRTHATNKVCLPLTSPRRLFFQLKLHHSVGHRIRKINERFQQISDERNKYQFRSELTMKAEEEKRETSSLIEEEEIFGRKEEKEDVISRLLSGSSQEKGVPVISIVGMGGIGKTTLAQIVYNDERVKDHFGMLIWLCVSDNFKVNELTKKIIESASDTKYEGPDNLNSMQSFLCKILSSKRFLIVLDDVWNENAEKWEQWSIPLKKGARGSRIVVTTRSHKVSRMMGSAHTFELKALSVDACWQVFSSKAFIGRTKDECLELEEIGRKIVLKCKGLPLAAKTIGSVMRSQNGKQDWDSMLGSEMWDAPMLGSEMSDAQTSVFPALFISYDNLPSYLKPCFLYCSVFQKDEKMVKNDVIKLWMAQGFIMAKKGKDIEDIGGEYFDALIDRSLFQDVEKDGDENIIHCKMHDLVHDLVRHIVKEECLGPDFEGRVLNPMAVRHSSHVSVDMVVNARNLRTLLSPKLNRGVLPYELFNHLTCLRTLDLSESRIVTLPQSIKHLKLLRYLDLSCTSLRKLPNQVTSLYNLQTLKINRCFELSKLPVGLTRMVNLRHLEAKGTRLLRNAIKGIGKMHSLRTLREFTVGVEHGHTNIGELKSLKLRGTLKIMHLERVASESEAKDVQITQMQHLRSLKLHWKTPNGEKWMGCIFESLEPPHENLRKLTITGYNGSETPRWMQKMSLFSKLTEVHLCYCTNVRHLPSLGMLPFLKVLEISNNNEIEQVGSKFLGNGVAAFPKLEYLEFCRLSRWTEWEMRSSKIQQQQQSIMPRLLKLIIFDCPKLKALPALGRLPSLEYLYVDGNEAVEQMGNEFYGYCNGGDDTKSIVFPNLKQLRFSRMHKWEHWELRVENAEITMPHLFELLIEECPKLKSLPDCLPIRLVELSVKGCHEITWMTSQLIHHALKECFIYNSEGLLLERSSLPCLTNLEKLMIVETTSLPDSGWEQLESLQTLFISLRGQLECFPDGLGQVRSLHTLCIYCPEIESLPKGIGQLKSLQKLTIQQCNLLRRLPDEIGQLKSLHTLKIISCDHLEALPRGVGQLKSLQKLSIKFCDGLRSLPNEMGQLESLQKLALLRCDQLRSLPDEIGQLKSLHTLLLATCSPLEALPEGVGQLKSLQVLIIEFCSQLRALPVGLTQLESLKTISIAACPKLRLHQDSHSSYGTSSQVEGDEDWHKIKHIPNIIIDHVTIRSERDT